MRLSRGSKLLDELWDSSVDMKDWDLTNFDGMYSVEMATGIIPNLPNWRKWINNPENMLTIDGSKVSGYNKYYTSGVFGDFGVRLHHYGKDGDEKLYTGLLLEYDNGRFKDYMRLIRPHLFLGKFCLVLMGKEIFMGYFWLSATEPRRVSRNDAYIRLKALADVARSGGVPIFKGIETEDVLVIADEAVEISPEVVKEVEKTTKPDDTDGWVDEDPSEIIGENSDKEDRVQKKDDMEDGWTEKD